MKKRFEALDRIRGLVMILMALDHAAFFILRTHYSEYWGTPFPGYPSTIAFVTRILSHVCAPTFFFLMGVSVALFAASRSSTGWTEGKIDRRLAIRGLVFIAADLLIFNFLWNAGSNRGVAGLSNMPGGGQMLSPVLFGVIFALGLCMFLSPLIRRLPAGVLALGGSVSIIATFFLVSSLDQVNLPYGLIERLIYIPGQTDSFVVLYTLFPWIGIMALGIGFGKRLLVGPDRAYALALWGGIAMLVAFSLLRFGFSAGDFQAPLAQSLQSYLTLAKYPPSLDYALLYLGIGLVLLGLLPKPAGKYFFFLETFGKVPFFFYALHLAVFCALGGLMVSARISYALCYLFWIVSVAAFYPLCLAFGRWRGKLPPDSIFRML